MNDAQARYLTYLAYGLSAAWAILVIYVITLVSREKSLRAQLESLRRMIDERERK